MGFCASHTLFTMIIFLMVSLHKETQVEGVSAGRFWYSSARGWGHKELSEPVWGHPPRIQKNRRIPDIKEGHMHRLDHGAARVVQSSHYELEYVLGRKIIFICTARGNPRPRITWYKDGVELYAHNYFQVHEWEIGLHKLKSKMEIDPATLMDVGYYECQANNKHAVDHRGFRTQYTAGL
ncbi:immunoglobulin domain-containing protein oig-4-like [Homarus americanus]|uniref:immunoglobulin domain-containing protein oig-4-like n=1 Tax=Homarus americanus TaxID=6706 RepID=UPI001C4659A3|nr:immunoglobulin domain-containing protein oig-4-like [Homarus americanus]